MLHCATIIKPKSCTTQSLARQYATKEGMEMSEREQKSREMMEQLEKLPPKAQERIGYMIEGALMLERIFYLRFFCTQVRRRTFFITAGEHKVLHILHGLGLSLLVELVKRGQQSRLPRGEYSFTV